MPVIKSAKKKLRQDKKRTAQNRRVKNILQTLIKKAEKTQSEAAVKIATQAADKAAKHNIIHKNKAARIKSALSKLLKSPTKPNTSARKSNKKTSKIKKK